jgi:hypothetical protein
MIIVKYIFFISSIIMFLSCNNEGKNEKPPVNDSPVVTSNPVTSSRFIYRFADSVLEERITDTLMKLPFVLKSNTYIDSFSNHQYGIAFMPDTTGGAISVAAGYNGPERFETYYNFSIDRKTFEIKILDPVSGDYISIEDYIKKNQEQ